MRLIMSWNEPMRQSPAEDSAIAPLQKLDAETHRPYTRPQRVEEAIRRALHVPIAELAERASILDKCSEFYIPTEVLVYLLRSSRTEIKSRAFETIYPVLIQRAYAASMQMSATDLASNSNQAAQFAAFVDLIAHDTSTYKIELDSFEIDFDQALAALV